MNRPAKLLMVAGLVTMMATGCTSVADDIAGRIRAAKSPIVREVEVDEPNFFTGRRPGITVYVVDDATEVQAREMWCVVMAPAGVGQLDQDDVHIIQGTPSRTTMVVSHVTCY